MKRYTSALLIAMSVATTSCALSPSHPSVDTEFRTSVGFELHESWAGTSAGKGITSILGNVREAAPGHLTIRILPKPSVEEANPHILDSFNVAIEFRATVALHFELVSAEGEVILADTATAVTSSYEPHTRPLADLEQRSWLRQRAATRAARRILGEAYRLYLIETKPPNSQS